jgi:hypothetical protein
MKKKINKNFLIIPITSIIYGIVKLLTSLNNQSNFQTYRGIFFITFGIGMYIGFTYLKKE